MTTDTEYALMAGYSYRTTRSQINSIPAPDDWTPFFPVPDPTTAADFPATSGFESVAFQNTANPNEIVIAYAGTDQGDITGDWPANAGLATGTGTGTGSDQRDTPMFGYGRQAIAIRRQDAAQRWHAATQSSMSPKAAH